MEGTHVTLGASLSPWIEKNESERGKTGMITKICTLQQHEPDDDGSLVPNITKKNTGLLNHSTKTCRRLALPLHSPIAVGGMSAGRERRHVPLGVIGCKSGGHEVCHGAIGAQ